jgi:hypothetical protein
LKLVDDPQKQLLATLGDVAADSSVDVAAADPALCADGVRRCCATSRLGKRCGGIAIRDHLLCAVHDGRADPSVGGFARAARYRREREQAAEKRVAMQLGTRAAIAATLAERSEQVASVVRLLLDDATDESRSHRERVRSAVALLGWLDQGLGRPTPRSEVALPDYEDDPRKLTTQELRLRVAAGRARLNAFKGTRDSSAVASSPDPGGGSTHPPRA